MIAAASAVIVTATVGWSTGSFIYLLASLLLVNADPGVYKYPFEQSIAHLSGYYAAAWMEFHENRLNFRTRIAALNSNGVWAWGNPPATAVVPRAPFFDHSFTDQLADPYVSGDPAASRFLLASLAVSEYGSPASQKRNVWLSRTNAVGNWLTNGVTYSNGFISIRQNSQPFLFQSGHTWDYPTVAARASDGKIMISVLDVFGTNASFYGYYTAISNGSDPDGTILFGPPVRLPVPYNPNRVCLPSRLVATQTKFMFFSHCRDVSTNPFLNYIDRWETTNGTTWTGPIPIGWVVDPAYSRFPQYPPFHSAYVAGGPGSGNPPGFYGYNPAFSTPQVIQRQLFEPVLLDARGSATNERWSLAFPGSILSTVSPPQYVHNIYHCSPYACGINDYDPTRDQFMAGTSVHGDDSWTSYYTYSDLPWRVKLKVLYGLPNGGWRVAMVQDNIDPGQWMLKGDTSRCGFSPSDCWTLGDYVHSAAAPLTRSMVLYPYFQCPTCPYTFSMPVRIYSSFLQDPDTPNIPNYTPVSIRFPLGSDLTRGLVRSAPVRVANPVFTAADSASRWAGLADPKPLKLCPKDGQVPLTGIPTCPNTP